MKRRIFNYLLTGVFLLLIAGCNSNTPPVESEINSVIAIVNRLDSLSRVKEISKEEADARIEAEISGLDLDNLNLEQIELISKGGMLYRYNALRKICQPSLLKISKTKDIIGARAAALHTVNFPMAADPEDDFANQLLWVEAFRQMVNHPAIGELMVSDDRLSSTVFSRLQFLDATAIGKSELIKEIVPLLDMPMSFICGSASVIFFDVASKADVGCTKEQVQEIREKVLAKTIETLDKYKIENPDSDSRIEHLQHVVAYLSGASSRGELIGYTAPEIHFDWNTIDGVKLLSELKGKVVIIDFWATWCSPCVGSFPNIRALKARYSDYPVVILGITNLQGSHTDQKNGRRIDTKGQPELEYSLMEEFIRDMDISWDIAFSQEPEFNEDFGVRGIPHVAIIDAEGIVRFNRLRPYEPPWHEAEKIDELLKEAGLPYPSEAMEKLNYSELEH